MIRFFGLIFCAFLIFIFWDIRILEANVDIIASPPKESNIEMTNTLLGILATIVSIFTVTVGYLYKTFEREARKKINMTAKKIAEKVRKDEFEKYSIDIKDEVMNKIYREFNAKTIRHREFVKHHGKLQNTQNSNET